MHKLATQFLTHFHHFSETMEVVIPLGQLQASLLNLEQNPSENCGVIRWQLISAPSSIDSKGTIGDSFDAEPVDQDSISSFRRFRFKAGNLRFDEYQPQSNSTRSALLAASESLDQTHTIRVPGPELSFVMTLLSDADRKLTFAMPVLSQASFDLTLATKLAKQLGAAHLIDDIHLLSKIAAQSKGA